MNVATSFGIITVLIGAGMLVGCGGTTSLGSSSSHDAGGNGGSSETGGGRSSGGSPGMSGGSPNTGGMGSGGAPATGGVIGMGGAPSTGGANSGGVPSSGGSAGSGACNSTNCSTFQMFDCCGDSCVNFENDPHNCGGCNNVCPDSAPVCSGRQCIVPPCTLPPQAGMCPPTSTCCGGTCCAANEICCHFSTGLPIPGPNIGCVYPKDSGGTCPLGCPSCICASPDTPIATPDGDRALATLHVGDRVLSVDHDRVIDVPIIDVRKTPAPNHSVVRVELASGAVLEISARHPTADGRTFGDLRTGERLGGVEIAKATIVPYRHRFTHDILPESDSGTYFSGGVLIGSTLGGGALSSRATDYASVSMQP
jgi:hypothetical protein